MFLIRIICLLTICVFSVFANVQLSVPNSIIKGEPLVFSLTASGNDITLPNLSNIDGHATQEISSSTSTRIINGEISKVIKKIYSLYPNKDIHFPTFEFIIDSSKFYTEEKTVFIKTPEKTNSDFFDLTLIANKKELFVGEDLILTLVFKYKKNSQIVDLSFEQPQFDDFWYKQLNDTKKYEENEFVVQELKFLLFPLKSGKLKINPLNIKAKIIDPRRDNFRLFSSGTSNINIYSNKIDLNVKTLPKNVNLVGEYDIKATVDKTEIKAGEAVSYKLEINGIGNIDDIEEIKLDIKDVIIYENKADIKSSINKNKYFGSYSKVFSIVPNSSFIIPSITLKYYDKQLEKVIEKSTDEFRIKVKDEIIKNSSVKLEKSTIKVKKDIEQKIIVKSSLEDKILYFLFGIISTLLILGLYLYVINSRKKKALNDLPLVKRVNNSKTKDELFKVLVVYIKINSQLDELIFRLEKSEDISQIKKDIIKLLKQIDIKR